MNLIELENIKEADRLLKLALEGKRDEVSMMERARELLSEIIEFKDFNNFQKKG